MAVDEVEVLAGLAIGDGTDADDAFFSQIEEGDPNWNTEVMSVIPAGFTHPVFNGIQGRAEEIPFTSQQVATAISKFGSFGADVSPSHLYYRKLATMDGFVAAATAEHTRFAAANVLGYMMNITAGHRRAAVVRGRLLPIYDGTNPVLVRSGTQAITPTPSADEVFELGPIVAPSENILPLCDNLDIQLNPQTHELSQNSEKRTCFGAVETISPVISFTTTDRDAPDLEGEVEGFKIHLVRMKNHDESYGSGESQHILLTIPQGLLTVPNKSDKPSAYRIEIRPSGDAADGWTGVPLTWAVNSAFSLTES